MTIRRGTILHGSCRKLHGDGEDCLAAAYELISISVEDVSNRPRALFLTGDQIYADDVAMPLIQHITKFGVELLGWEEQIHGLNKKLTEIGIGERQRVVRDHAKLPLRKQAIICLALVNLLLCICLHGM